jgi:hypothetical protein
MKIVTIRLDASTQSLLDWGKEEKEAALAEKIEWYFDWNITAPLEDERQFHGFWLAIDHFKEKIYPLFADKTMRVLLFKGKVPSCEKDKAEWLLDRSLKETSFTSLMHERDVFFDFLKLLSSAFPVEIPLAVSLDLTMLTGEELLEYLSYEPLWDFSLTIQTDLPWQIDQHSREAFLLSREGRGRDAMLSFLSDHSKSFRLTFEDNLNMYWDLVETLYLDSSSLTSLGKRMVRGFALTGGIVVDINERESCF